MKNKKIFGVVLAVILAFSLMLACSEPPLKPIEGATPIDRTKYLENLSFVEYNNFRGNDGITDAKTPIIKDNIGLQWEAKVAAGYSTGWPIEVGNYLYVSSDQVINKLSKKDGSIVKQQSLSARIGFFSSIAYGDGKIFVPIDGGIIEAFDADTLKPLFKTKKPYDKNGAEIASLQSLSSILYHNGYIYMGVSDGGGSNGAFFCVSTKDENPALQNEEKDFTWIFNTKDLDSSVQGGFYWSVGVIVGEHIFFVGEGGVLYSHHLTDNAKDKNGVTIVKDIFPLEGETQAIRSSLFYDAALGRIYATSKAGYVHSIKVNSDGTFNKAEGSYIKSEFVSSNITSSPTGYRGRLYVGGGGMGASATFSVLNGETLDIIYTLKIGTQSSPMITTAYATAENNYKVYIYVTKSVGTASNPDGMYIIEDYTGKTEDDNSTQFIASNSPNYNSSSVMISKDGLLYYKNDTGLVFAYGEKTSDNEVAPISFTANDVVNAINNLPNADDFKDYNKNEVLRVFYRYTKLTSEEKAKVTNYNKLEQNLIKLDKLLNI